MINDDWTTFKHAIPNHEKGWIVPREISSWGGARGYRGYIYIYEWIMKRLRDVWKWNPFSPFGSYALLYIEKSMHIEWLSSNGRPCYIYDHIYIYMRIYPTKYILYLYLAKQLDKQHLLKLYTLINVGRARRYLRCCEWILYDSSKGYFLYIFVSLAKI